MWWRRLEQLQDQRRRKRLRDSVETAASKKKAAFEELKNASEEAKSVVPVDVMRHIGEMVH